MTTFTPGTRVVVRNSGPHLSGLRGVVIEKAANLLNGHHCCVRLDDHDPAWPLCFYAHELAAEK